MGDDYEIVIPETINGVEVNAIGEEAFMFSSITSITIPGSVKTIGKDAFGGCDELESIILEEGIEHIGEMAFHL